jgi:hypothetical protein
MAKSPEIDREIIRMRNAQYSVKEIAEAVDCSYNFVQRRCKKFELEGIVKFKAIGRHKTPPKPKTKYVKQPQKLGCMCDYPGCKDQAEYTFSLVPLCTLHYEMVSDETDAHYNDNDKETDRRHWNRIKERSAELWENQKASTSTRTKSKRKKKESAAEQKEQSPLKVTQPSWLTF